VADTTLYLFVIPCISTINIMGFFQKILNFFTPKQASPYSKKEDDVLKTGSVSKFYKSLDNSLKNTLDVRDIVDLVFEDKVIYTFYDLEDGNYFAADAEHNVYSCIHGAKPMIAAMHLKINDLMNGIQNKTFNIKEHFNERYSGKF